jgi:hypothetical protein
MSGGAARWDPYLVFINRPDGIVGRVQYKADSFPEETMMRMLRELAYDKFTSEPNSGVSDLPSSKKKRSRDTEPLS